MLKLVVSAFLILLIVALTTGAARRLMPHEAMGVETATPQQVYFRLQRDDELTVKP
jgi:hypothetical protein